jgi:hypothetical protein
VYVKPLLKCPLPYLDKSVPFFLLNVRVRRVFIIDLARSEALRSPKGEALRAQRRQGQ